MMKKTPNYFLIVIMILFTSAQFGISQKSINSVYHQYSGPNSTKVSVPGWLIKMGSWFVTEPGVKTLMKKIHNVKMIVNEELRGELIDLNPITSFAKKNGFEQLLEIKDQGNYFHIYAISKNESIRKILITGFDDEEFFSTYLSLDIKMEELSELINDLDDLGYIRTHSLVKNRTITP